MCSDNSVKLTEAQQPKVLSILTWNCENIKNNIYCLKDFLYQEFPADLIFLSEPNIFQHDLKSAASQLKSNYCMYLNSDDLHDPELAMIRSRIMGGTLVMWATHLDPFVTVHQPASSSATALI